MSRKVRTYQSEATKEMSTEELAGLQEKVAAMTPEELETFRNGFDPDMMGFDGAEAPDIPDEEQKPEKTVEEEQEKAADKPEADAGEEEKDHDDDEAADTL